MKCSHPKNTTKDCHTIWCPRSRTLSTQAMWDCEYGDPNNPHRTRNKIRIIDTTIPPRQLGYTTLYLNVAY